MMGWSLFLLALLSTTAAAGEKSTWCDDEDRNCADLEVIRPGGVQVLYVGEDDREPQFLPLHSFSAKRGYLGVGLTSITPELRRFFGVPEQTGVLISSVEAGSPAELAGLKVGDVITLVDGKEIESPAGLTRIIRDKEDGETAALEVWRDGRPVTLSATLVEKERTQYDLGQLLQGGKLRMEGLEALDRFKDLDGNLVFRFDPETARDYAQRWRTYVQGCAEGEEDCPFGRFGLRSRERELEQRIEELEAKLRALAERLDSRSGR